MKTIALFMLNLALLIGVPVAENREAPVSEPLPLYGNTPELFRPFGRFVQEPYRLLFIDPLEFTGPGRDKPEPDVETVKIGVIAPLERSHEAYMGRPKLGGIQIAIDEANARGGYKGKPFELVVRNDTGLWGASANEIAAFSYQDSAWAIIGSIDGANTHIALRVTLKTEVPMMNIGDTDPTLVETKIPWIFRIIQDDRQMAYTLAFYLYAQRDFSRVAILRADNRYGRFGVREFRDGSVRFRRPVPIEINYELNFQRVNPDFTAQIRRLQRVKPEAVVLWADAEPAGHLVLAMRRAGLDMPIFASERIVNPLFLAIAGAAAEGVHAVYPYDPDADCPRLKRFQKAYRENFGEEPTAYAAYGYDGTWMVIEAIRQAGLNRARIRDALADMKRYEGITGEAIMDEVYSNRAPVIMATVRNGRWVFNEPRLLSRF